MREQTAEAGSAAAFAASYLWPESHPDDFAGPKLIQVLALEQWLAHSSQYRSLHLKVPAARPVFGPEHGRLRTLAFDGSDRHDR